MVECVQEGFQMPAVVQYPPNQSASGHYDLTWYLNEVCQESFEFHPQNISARCRDEGYQTIPSLQVPGQGGDDHVGPIRDQPIRRHSQSIDSALELTDDVFLVAAVVGEKNDFLIGHLAIVGDVEEVPLIPRSELAV